MVFISINGIQVDFPYPPYPAQIRYMSSVIDSLRNGQNALLESPTGTGKTLCLICAALAWRATYIAALQAFSNRRPGDTAQAELFSNAGLRPPQGAASALAALIRPDIAPQLSAPRIVFSSRTHSQLVQAVSELKKTVYKPAMVQLASRDQLCVHEISGRLGGGRLNAMCRKLTAPSRRGCRYYLPVMSNRDHENRSEELVEKMHSGEPMDIEELKTFGNKEAACPYFLSRCAAKNDSCEILFLPYNYLLDRSVRGSLSIDWANDIIIFDEAHNLESICSDSMSFDMSDSLRKTCDLEFSGLLEHAIKPGGISIPALEHLSKSEEGMQKLIGSENCELQEIRLMRAVMKSVEDFINTAELRLGGSGDVSFAVFPGEKLRKIFSNAGGPSPDTYELFLEMLDRAMGVQADKEKPEQTENHTGSGAPRSGGSSAIKFLQSSIRILFESIGDGYGRFFRTVIQQSKSNTTAGRTLSYWCFKPAVAMNEVKKLKMRCMLLTSGTLSPMDSFAAELGVHFPVRLENPHVVLNEQVWAGVVKLGPDHEGIKGGRLTSAYHARGDDAHLELGRTLIRIAATVPDGLLVFFPSYGTMYACMDTWKRLGPRVNGQKPSVWEHLLRHKRLVAEERESSKFAAALLAHKTNVEAGVGSMLFAVCRGKVSEGIDFSDEYGRAVVITGLPYPSAFDPRVVLKRQLSDAEAKAIQKAGPRSRKNSVLNGSQWYTTQAIRAVNQAVGRAIRHKFDYGGIILCDERFQSKHLQHHISKWIQPSLSVFPTFQNADESLRDFFSQAVNSSFAKSGEERRLEARRQHQLNRSQKKPDDDMAAVRVAQETINHLMPVRKTEKQFLEKVLQLSEEMKKKTPSPHAKKRKAARGLFEGPKLGLLDFGSASVESSANGSGSLSIPVTQGPSSASIGEKWSSRFFAERENHCKSLIDKGDREQQIGVKRARLMKSEVKSVRHDPRRMKIGLNSSNTESGKGSTLSTKIKVVFRTKEAIREFLKLFREVLRAHGKMESSSNLEKVKWDRVQAEARGAVSNLVRFALDRLDRMEANKLFADMRCKIPMSLRMVYDGAVRE